MAYLYLAIILYTISFGLLLITFYFDKPLFQTLQTLAAGVAFIANLIHVFQWWHAAPSLSIQNFFTLISLCIAFVYILVNLRYKKPYVGFLLLPMILICCRIALFTSPTPMHDDFIGNIWLYMHIPLTVLGTAFFMAAFAAGILYFLLEKQLKKKRFGRIFSQFPSLFTINKINVSAMFLGQALYTMGLISAFGGLQAINFDISKSMLNFKIVIAMFAWFVFTIILILKLHLNITAKQTAMASIIGFISVLLTYAGAVFFMVQ